MTKPLLEKEYTSFADGVINIKRLREIEKVFGHKVDTEYWFKKEDVVEELRRFENKINFRINILPKASIGEDYTQATYELNYILEIFKECFGVLPNEEEK